MSQWNHSLKAVYSETAEGFSGIWKIRKTAERASAMKYIFNEIADMQ